MGMLRILFLLIFLTSPLQAAAIREDLLEEIGLRDGAPRVPVLLERAHLINTPLHNILAREVLIMMYHDKNPVNIGQVFSMAGLPETPQNLEIIIRLIDAIPSDEEKGDGPFDPDCRGKRRGSPWSLGGLINRFLKPILFLGA